jgi:copper resistance protein C
MIRIFLLTFTSLLLLAGIRDAAAHAFLDHAEPPVGHTVSAAPGELRLWFTQSLEAAFSTVTVTKDGHRIDAGKPRVSGNEIAVSLKPAGKGTYHVNWRVLSVDTHTTAGDFSFTVGP